MYLLTNYSCVSVSFIILLFCRPFIFPLPPLTKGSEPENLVFTRKSFQYIKENRMPLSIPPLLLGTLTCKKNQNKADQKGKKLLHAEGGSVNVSAKKEMLYFCQDLYYVTKSAKMENINSKDMQILLHRLATHKNIYKTRQLLKTEQCERKSDTLQAQLHQYVEELRVNVVQNSKFQSSFCTSDVLHIFLEADCCDQLYCVSG